MNFGNTSLPDLAHLDEDEIFHEFFLRENFQHFHDCIGAINYSFTYTYLIYKVPYFNI